MKTLVNCIVLLALIVGASVAVGFGLNLGVIAAEVWTEAP